jgi:hypothetical protein
LLEMSYLGLLLGKGGTVVNEHTRR